MLKQPPCAKVKKNDEGKNEGNDCELFHNVCFCLFELI